MSPVRSGPDGASEYKIKGAARMTRTASPIDHSGGSDCTSSSESHKSPISRLHLRRCGFLSSVSPFAVLLRWMCLSIRPGIAFACIVLCRAKRLKIEYTLIHEKRRCDVGDRRRDAV